MKAILVLFMMSAFAATTDFAAAVTGRERVSMSAKMMNAPRTVAEKNQMSANTTLSPQVAVVSKSSIKAGDLNADLAINPEPMISGNKVDLREKEKMACINNNIGVGNTFVWASRYSNTNDYATMVEDVEVPENNTCFVKIELKSNDSKIAVGDIKAKYYEMGKNIACGAWVDEDMLRTRILDAKKSARTWATVGGAVGGAAVGVGAMELFGNRLIGGDVMGQKQFEEGSVQQVRAQLNALKKENDEEYKKFIDGLGALKKECQKDIWKKGVEKPKACDDYEKFFELAQM